MYEPKPIVAKTIDGTIIEVYDYLTDCLFIPLANDLVIGINQNRDEIMILTVDKNGFYFDIATSYLEKPTQGSVKINFSSQNLQAIETFNKQGMLTRNVVSSKSEDILNLILNFYRRDL